MSDTFYKFIPSNPYTDLQPDQMKRVGKSIFETVDYELECSKTIRFADAGGNFSSVTCPFCQSNLNEWWGGAMDNAYSREAGFADLAVKTPCCDKDTSLNDLTYDWPQGFYKVMFAVRFGKDPVDYKAILQALEKETGIEWRVVMAHI